MVTSAKLKLKLGNNRSDYENRLWENNRDDYELNFGLVHELQTWPAQTPERHITCNEHRRSDAEHEETEDINTHMRTQLTPMKHNDNTVESNTGNTNMRHGPSK